MNQPSSLRGYERKVLPIALALLMVVGAFVVFSTPFSRGQSVGLAIDGSNLVDPNAQTTSTTIPLTTTNPNDVIMICVSTTNYFTGAEFAPPIVKSVKDSAGLTWTDRGGVTPEPIGAIGWRVEEWTAIASAPLSNDLITVSLSGISYTDLDAFGISGANTASPFDTLNPSATGGTGVNGAHSSVATTLVSTTNPNDMIVGCTAIGGAIAYGSGFTPLENTGVCTGCGNGDQLGPFQGLASEYTITSSPQVNLPVTFTDITESGWWAVMADAIVPLQASTTTSNSTTTSSTTSTTSSTSSISSETLVTSTCTVTFAMSNGNVVGWQGQC